MTGKTNCANQILVDLQSHWEPYPWQAQALQSLCRNNVWVVARQAGKSALLRYVAATFALKFPGTEGGYITARMTCADT